MTTFPEMNSETGQRSKHRVATTPALQRFIIGFAIVEAVIIGWALFWMNLR